MASRIYTAAYSGTLTNSGADADLLECLPGDDKPVRLLGWCLSQLSELGDAAEESLRITVRRMAATITSGSGGSAVTPRSQDSGDATAFAGTVECNNSTVATTTGTATSFVLNEFCWNIRGSPWDFFYPFDRLCPTARQGEGLFVRCESTAADDISIGVTFWLEEF